MNLTAAITQHMNEREERGLVPTTEIFRVVEMADGSGDLAILASVTDDLGDEETEIRTRVHTDGSFTDLEIV